MNNKYWLTIKESWPFLALLISILTVLSFIISAAQTPKYRSEATMLIIQDQKGSMDAYTAARSAETISSLLSDMIYTSSFFERVMDSKFGVENNFSQSPDDQEKQWRKTVSTQLANNSGVLKIIVTDPSRNQADKITRAIASVLTFQGDIYHGGGDTVKIKMIDSPKTSEQPVEPSIIANTISAFLLALFLAAIYVLFSGLQKQSVAQTVESKTPKIDAKEIENGNSYHEPNQVEFEPEVNDDYFSGSESPVESLLDDTQNKKESAPEFVRRPSPEDYFNSIK